MREGEWELGGGGAERRAWVATRRPQSTYLPEELLTRQEKGGTNITKIRDMGGILNGSIYVPKHTNMMPEKERERQVLNFLASL